MTKLEIKAFWDAIVAATPALVNEPTIDWKIREAIENFILAVAPQAVTFPFDTLSLNPLEWSNLFLKNGVTHGYVIRRVDRTSEWVRLTTTETYAYNVWGFYGFSSKSRAQNSDREFQRILDNVSYLLSLKPKLGLDGGVDEHGLLQFRDMDTMGDGSKQMHFAPGRLEVKLCC